VPFILKTYSLKSSEVNSRRLSFLVVHSYPVSGFFKNKPSLGSILGGGWIGVVGTGK